ncbi:hypothetical protein HanIR_Chr05g0232691 [Helianthus annuus]|nr:hypothetical protein HanIR_Chr05g0232691 [Helianthus annuus]
MSFYWSGDYKKGFLHIFPAKLAYCLIMYFPKPKKQLHISPFFKKLPNYPCKNTPLVSYSHLYSRRLIWFRYFFYSVSYHSMSISSSKLLFNC